MKTTRSLSRPIARVFIALSFFTYSHLAHADAVNDWLSGKLRPDLPAITYNGPVQNVKFGHPAPPVSIAIPLWNNALARIAANTNQKLVFKEYGGGTLIGPKDGFRAVRSGIAEMATCYLANEGRNFSLSKVWELPFVTPNNPMVATRIAQELAPKYFEAEFSKSDVGWAGSSINQPSDIFSKKPIRKLEDFQGMKIVAQGFSPEAAKALGASLVNIPYPDVYTALQQGLVDAVVWSDGGFIPYKIYEIAKYRTKVGLHGSSISYCYNKEWYAKLSPDLQKSYSASVGPAWVAMAKVVQIDFSKSAGEVYSQNGIETIVLAPAEIKRIHERLQPVIDKWTDAQERDGRPARQLLADIKRLSEKYSAMSSDDLMNYTVKNPVPVSK
jgi:TRAP-type C4-dicarboxylate transport system substrate-binding protein